MVTKEFMARTSALLPTGKRMNPLKPELAEYYDPGQVAYIVNMRSEWDTGSPPQYRILTSFGDLGDAWAVGTKHEIRHDQTLRSLGTARVVGIIDFRTGQRQGGIPFDNGKGRALPHYVFK